MEENQTTTIQNELVKKKRSPWIAGLLSYLCLGLGHIYCGKLKKGIIIYFVGNSIIIFFIFLFFLLPSPYSIISSLLICLTYAFIIIDSVKIALKESDNYVLKPYNLWYVYLLIYICLTLFYSILIIAPLMKSEITEAYRMPTGSMENTILIEDFILVDKLAYGIHIPFSLKLIFKYKNIERGDIIIFLYPGDRDEIKPPEKISYMKRCIGISGDTIQIRDKILFVNGKMFKEPSTVKFDNVKRPKDFVNPRMFPKGANWNEDWYGPIVVPKRSDKIKIDSLNFEAWRIFVIREGHSIKMAPDKKILVDDKVLSNGEYEVENNYLFCLEIIEIIPWIAVLQDFFRKKMLLVNLISYTGQRMQRKNQFVGKELE